MRICFSLTNLELGGAQVFVIRLANFLAAKHGKPVYIYDHWPELRHHHTLHYVHPLVKIISYSENPAWQWLVCKINAALRIFDRNSEFRHSLNRKGLSRQLKKYDINVLNSHMAGSDFVISGIALPPACQLVLTLHGEYELMLKHVPKEEMRSKIRRTIEQSAAIIYTANKNLEPVKLLVPAKGITATKISVGFDASGFNIKKLTREDLGISPDEFIIGMISRGFPEKGWDTAIKAVQIVSGRSSKKIRLVCIAQGKYIKELVDATADPNITLIQFKHNFQDYFSCYPLFDLFFFPTRFEGESVPNVVIESLYWSTPVLASKHAEIPSMLQVESNQPAGICIDPAGDDTPEKFAIALMELLSDNTKLQFLRNNCSKAFKSFEMAKVASQYETVFQKVLKY
jgi:glycosyltransferase involved in cell wall biosynthesis